MRRILAILVVLCGAFVVLTGVRAQTAAATRSYTSGWNLVAFPPGTDLAGVTTLYTFQPGDTDYESVPLSQTTNSGYGYWAYFPTARSSTLGVGTSSAYSVVIAAPAGQYVMIGDPSGAYPAVVSGADQVLTYDPTAGYQEMTTLEPGQGAWAVSVAGGTITVTPNPTAAATATANILTPPIAPPTSATPSATGTAPSAASATPSATSATATPSASSPTSVPGFATVHSASGFEFRVPQAWYIVPGPVSGSILANSPDFGASVLGTRLDGTFDPIALVAAELQPSPSRHGFMVIASAHAQTVPGADAGAAGAATFATDDGVPTAEFVVAGTVNGHAYTLIVKASRTFVQSQPDAVSAILSSFRFSP